MNRIKSLLFPPRRSKKENGQAIVLIALFMVVMLGMVGLAIDGGGMFLLWRDARNAADTAVMQAAYARCTDAANDPTGADADSWQGIGYAAASVNGFPTGVTVGTTRVNGIDYTSVDIDAEKPSYFIHLVFSGPLTIHTQALAYCRPAVKLGSIPGGYALGESGYCSGGREFEMSMSNARIYGEVGTNGDMVMNFSSGNPAEIYDDIYLGGLLYGNEDQYSFPDNAPGCGIGTCEDEILTGQEQVTSGEVALISFTDYAPGGLVWEEMPQRNFIDNAGGSTWALSLTDPVTGVAFKDENGNAQTQLEGLYYVTGDVRKSGNFPAIGPEGITIVALGTIDVAGPAGYQWEYYERIMDETSIGVKYPGILFASAFVGGPQCAAADVGITFGAGDSSYVHGVIYAPNSGIKSTFNNLRPPDPNPTGIIAGFHGTLIGMHVTYSGSRSDWYYDPSLVPPRPPMVNNVQ